MPFMVAYAKITAEKEIELVGVYFGGVTNTQAEADDIARRCVKANHSSYTTILPKVAPLDEPTHFFDVLDSLEEKFEQLVEEMIDADAVTKKKAIKLKKKRCKAFQ
jgi:hypothetical protein